MTLEHVARRISRNPIREGLDGRPPRWTKLLAWAGIIGPVLFTLAFMGQELLRRGEYSPVAEPVSALEAGPNGWIQQANFVVFGLLTIAFAVGLHLGVRPRFGILAPALVGISGLGLLLAAVFPLRQDAAGVTYDPGGHVVAGVMFFLSSALALIVVSRRLVGDPRWRSIAGYSLGAGLAALIGFFAMGLLVMPDDAPLHDVAGLAQRALILVVLFPARVVISIRLLQVTNVRR